MKSIALPLILILTAFVAAQIPASLPSSAPSTEPTPQTAPVTLPATEAATKPATNPIVPATTSPSTEPAATAPSTAPISGSSYRPFSSYSSSPYGGRDSFRTSPLPPSSSPSGMDFKPKPYPRQYSAMLSRSIFLKGSQRVFDSGSRSDVPMPSTAPSGTSTPRSSSGAESILVFNGASDANGQMVAFIENTGMNQIGRYHAGDLVGQGATGRITAITLDSINYTVGPRVVHVNLGQNLNGQDVLVLTTQPVAEGTTPTTGAAGTTQPSSGAGGLSDIERRMRERRMKELGQ